MPSRKRGWLTWPGWGHAAGKRRDVGGSHTERGAAAGTSPTPVADAAHARRAPNGVIPGTADHPLQTVALQPARYHAPEVDDARLAAFVNREAGDQRVFDDMTARFPQLTSARDIAAVAQVLKDPADDDTVRHETAALLARSGYPGLVADLLGILNNPAEGARFRGWAMQHLQLNYAAADPKQQEAVLAQLRTSLADRHQTVRRESLLALHRLAPAEGLAVARAWLHATAAGADAGRDLAIRVIREQDARDELATVRQYARHPDPALRIAALVTLAAWKDEASREAMADAAASADPRLRRCGERALAPLAATPE